MRNLLVTIILCVFSCSTNAQKKEAPFFKAKGLVVISDADMTASAYIDGKLNKMRGAKDILSIMALEEKDTIIYQLEVSNSVTNWTKSLALTKDGNYAFVAETRGGLPDSVQQVSNIFEALPPARKLTVIDIKTKTVISHIDAGTIPLVAQLNTTETILVTCVTDIGAEIVFIDWKAPKFGRKQSVAMPLKEGEIGRVTDITWHPSGHYLALTLEELGQIVFLAFKNDNGNYSIEKIGEAITINGLVGAGQFTSDGKDYIVPNLKNWVDDGELVSIRPDFKEGEHAITSIVQVGRAPEGFAISPNNDFVVVANMKGSHFPREHPLFTATSSLSLLSLDHTAGKLKMLEQYPFEGILPENIVFDQDGDTIALVVYEYHGKDHGGVEFWELETDPMPVLMHLPNRIQVAKGAHALEVLK